MGSNKTVDKAHAAKELGYTHMATLAKRYYRMTYWYVMPLDTVITDHGWKPKEGRQQMKCSQVDWKTTIKRNDLKLAEAVENRKKQKEEEKKQNQARRYKEGLKIFAETFK